MLMPMCDLVWHTLPPAEACGLSRQGVGALGVRRGRVIEVGARGLHPRGLAARVGVAVVLALLAAAAAAAPPPTAAALSTALPSAALLSAAALAAAALVCPHHNRLALEL